MGACPKCGFNLVTNEVECPRCGVILAKVRSIPSRSAVATEQVNSGDVEAQDAKKVDRALAMMAEGDIAEAEALLLSVIANSPAGYVNLLEDPDGTLTIKVWDEQEFVHYVMWQRQQGIKRDVQCIGNAYPRAYFYMGFLCVKTRQFERALEYLERGHELEPTNPKFNFEKAQALVHSGNKERALALYQAINEIGPYVSTRDLGIAQRGCGFVLIEMGRLDEAEEAFRASLELEPGNSVALGELQYIDHLRKGGGASQGEAFPTQVPDLSKCSVCGNPFTEGIVVSVKGIPHSVCDSCERKLTKKWWQFWRRSL